MKWFVHIFPEVDARLSRPELWTPETARLEVEKCAPKLKLIPTVDDPGTNETPAPIPDTSPATLEANVEAEEQFLKLLANENTWYKNAWTPWCAQYC